MKIIWTEFAVENLKQIFDYYSANATAKVAHKIRKQILAAAKQLLINPESGQIEYNLKQLKNDYRYLVSGNYKLIYRISGNEIIINDMFDTRQDPSKMNDEKRLNE